MQSVREQLQIVASMIPEIGREKYLRRFREHAWDVFRDHLYEEALSDDMEAFNFDLNDETAPHYALHYESIKRGVQEASKIRVQEVQEDYPWVQKLFEPLSGISVPCHFEEVKQIWEKKGVLEDLGRSIETAGVRLPPSRINKGPEGVLQDLVDLGLLEFTTDGRINLPDVYRVGYGIGRRGGVKPVAR